MQKADLAVADSLSQSELRGEISQALEAGTINLEQVHELGNIIVTPELHRRSDEKITIADLTGVAIQDIQISVAFYEALRAKKK